MTDSDRILAQHNEAAEPSVDLSIDHPTSMGIGAVSGGLAGAVLGNMVAGRLGAAIGAVVGGVAGAAISHEKGEEISHAVDNAVETAKEKAQEIKPSVMSALDQAENKASNINPSAAKAVNTLKSKVDEVTPDKDSDSSSSTSADFNAQNFTPQQSLSAPEIESSTEYRSGYNSEAAYTPSDLSNSSYMDKRTIIQDTNVTPTSTADDIYSAGNLDATSAYVEDTSYIDDSSLSSAADRMDSSSGYAASGYSDSSSGYYTDRSSGYIDDDLYSPDPINSGSAYLEDQTANYESMSSTGYATDTAYPSANIASGLISADEQYDLGIALGKQGDLAGAIAAFQSVVAQDPNYAEAHYNLGVVLCKYGLTEQGVTHIEQSKTICQSEGRTKEAENIDRILQNLAI